MAHSRIKAFSSVKYGKYLLISTDGLVNVGPGQQTQTNTHTHTIRFSYNIKVNDLNIFQV